MVCEQVADRIVALIESGVLRDGQKIPSLRSLSEQLHVSVNTVREAYWRLENRHYIEAVPQSGYYVRSPAPLSPKGHGPASLDPREVSLCHVYAAMKNAEGSDKLVQLGAAVLDANYAPDRKLRTFYREAFQRYSARVFDYMMSPGYLPLREQISLLSMRSGERLTPDDLIITSGCGEAVFLSLMAICRRGDVVAIESPVYFNMLSVLDRLGITPVEIPSVEGQGVNLEVLAFVLEHQPVKAVCLIPNFANPMGTVMPTERKRRLLDMLARFDIPLIEDDVYGDLGYRSRPDTCKAYDTDGRVVLCSSFSKTIAPGLRLGWTAPGRYYDEVLNAKTTLNLGSPSVDQIALAMFLREGGYERHLRRIRGLLRQSVHSVREAILESFPAGTRVTDPEGGFVLWVTLPPRFDTMTLYFKALDEHILIAPGCLFSRTDGFRSCLRISAGNWNPRVERAIQRLGVLL